MKNNITMAIAIVVLCFIIYLSQCIINSLLWYRKQQDIRDRKKRNNRFLYGAEKYAPFSLY